MLLWLEILGAMPLVDEAMMARCFRRTQHMPRHSHCFLVPHGRKGGKATCAREAQRVRVGDIQLFDKGATKMPDIETQISKISKDMFIMAGRHDTHDVR